VQPGGYLPRRVYGRYVESILREAHESSLGRFEWRRDEAVAIRQTDGKTEIHLRGGDRIAADRTILALGNFPPADPKFPGRTELSSRYISNPWASNALDGAEQDEADLLVGSGLTSVDVAIALRERGFEVRSTCFPATGCYRNNISPRNGGQPSGTMNLLTQRLACLGWFENKCAKRDSRIAIGVR
jgi:uncharacterized NAD(P)/FAD-binding protein YdhS